MYLERERIIPVIDRVKNGDASDKINTVQIQINLKGPKEG